MPRSNKPSFQEMAARLNQRQGEAVEAPLLPPVEPEPEPAPPPAPVFANVPPLDAPQSYSGRTTQLHLEVPVEMADEWEALYGDFRKKGQKRKKKDMATEMLERYLRHYGMLEKYKV